MRNYESGNVPSPPPYLRDVFNKCEKCGATWIGPARPTCSACAPGVVPGGSEPGVVSDVPPLPESVRADMMRQLYGTPTP